MATIRELARLAGVSICTVSKALSGAPGVAEATRQHILSLADLYHYHPNRLYQAALAGKSALIGCIVPDISFSFYARLVKGLLEVCYEEGYRPIVLESHGQVTHTCKALDVMADLRVEGIMAFGGHSDLVPKELMMKLASLEIPLIACHANFSTVPTHTVVNDEMAVMRVAAEYLIGLGHRVFAYIGPTKGPVSYRKKALETVLQTYGMRLAAFDLAHVDDPLFTTVQAIMHHTPLPTAILTFSDTTAFRLLQALASSGKHVPHDFSVIGIGNDTFCPFAFPPLTSIDHQAEQVGREAVKLIRFLTSQQHVDPSVCNNIIDPQLVIRNSCGKPRYR